MYGINFRSISLTLIFTYNLFEQGSIFVRYPEKNCGQDHFEDDDGNEEILKNYHDAECTDEQFKVVRSSPRYDPPGYG
jgi:hypothetical protein